MGAIEAIVKEGINQQGLQIAHANQIFKLKQIIAEQNHKIKDYEHKVSNFSEIHIIDPEMNDSQSIPSKTVSYRR